MTSYVTLKKNTAYKFYVGLIDQSNTKLLKANPTIASGDFKVSTDGGAFANLPLGARRDLLRVLTSDSRVRADVVRQFHERGDEGMVEVLTELEADDVLRMRVTTILQASVH